jgi:hypothetical protein
MFNSIKIFIAAFKQALNAMNADKIEAKDAIDKYRANVEYIGGVTEKMKTVYTLIGELYDCFPIKERQDFVLKTHDLLRYGRFDENTGNLKDGANFVTLYKHQYEDMKRWLKNMVNHYNAGHYKDVVDLYKIIYEPQLEKFYISIGASEPNS